LLHPQNLRSQQDLAAQVRYEAGHNLHEYPLEPFLFLLREQLRLMNLRRWMMKTEFKYMCNA